MDTTKIEVEGRLPTRMLIRDGRMEARITIEAGKRTHVLLPPERMIEFRPFAMCSEEMGNRAMTTTVVIHPHPGTGLKVKVEQISQIDGHAHTEQYLHKGDHPLTVHASDSLAIRVSEVKDELPQEVEGDTLTA